jgi:hypothetical protein
MPKRKIDEISDEYDDLIIKIFKNVIMTFKIQDSLLKKMSIKMIQCIIKILENLKTIYIIIIKNIIEDCIKFSKNDYLKISFMIYDEEEIFNRTLWMLYYSYDKIISIININQKYLCIMHGGHNYTCFNNKIFNKPHCCLKDKNMDDKFKFYFNIILPLLKKIFYTKIIYGVLSIKFLYNLFENDVRKIVSINNILNVIIYKKYFLNIIESIKKNNKNEINNDSLKIFNETCKDLNLVMTIMMIQNTK